MLLACAVFSCSTSVLASEQLSEELKGALRKGHLMTCVTVIKDQAERNELDLFQWKNPGRYLGERQVQVCQRLTIRQSWAQKQNYAIIS